MCVCVCVRERERTIGSTHLDRYSTGRDNTLDPLANNSLLTVGGDSDEPNVDPDLVDRLVLVVVTSVPVHNGKEQVDNEKDEAATQVKDRVTNDQGSMATEHDADLIEEVAFGGVDDALIQSFVLVVHLLGAMGRFMDVPFVLLPGVQDVVNLLGRRKVSVDKIKEMLGWVRGSRQSVADLLKVRGSVSHVTCEGLATLGKDHDLVEPIVDLGGGLMDRTDDNQVLFLGNTDDLLHDVGGGSGIQSGRWFVKEQQGGLLQKSNRDRQTTALSSTETSAAGVLAGVEAHLTDDVVNDGPDVTLVGHLVELGGVHESLTSREVRPVLVLLLDDCIWDYDDIRDCEWKVR